MRVLSGKARGRRLRSPRTPRIRPTSAKVKEAVFHILGDAVHGATFLDLCAGSGAVGIEAASRGARRVVWVDEDPRAVRLITQNLRTCDLEGGEVVRSSAERFLQRAGREGRVFDVVFVDLPYAARDRLEEILALLDAFRLLAPDGTLLVEHAARQGVPPRTGNLVLAKTYRYGDTALARYRWEPKRRETLSDP